MPITKSPNSSTAAPLPKAIMLLGTWNAGKSTLAMSASKNYPPLPWQPFTPLNPKPLDWKPVLCDDAFVHAWEPDCFAGFVDCGLGVPPHWDMAAVTGSELDSSIDSVCEETTKRVKSGQTRFVVVDTVSAFNTKNHAHAMFGMSKASSEEDTQKQTETNLQKVWGAVLSRHIRYLNGLLSANPELIIFNVHPKVNDPGFRGGKDAKALSVHAANQKAKGFSSDSATIAPEITGQAFGQYMRNCSLVMYIEATEKNMPVPGKPGQFAKAVTRTLNPHKKDDVLARSKYACLSEKEPADLRVIFDKIRNSSGAQT